MPSNVIVQVSAIGQVNPNDLDFLGHMKHLMGEPVITIVDAGETEVQHIDLIKNRLISILYRPAQKHYKN